MHRTEEKGENKIENSLGERRKQNRLKKEIEENRIKIASVNESSF